MLLRGTGRPLDLLDGRFDQLAMTFAVKAFADDPAHRLDDDVRHLQAYRLNGPLAVSIDVPAGRLDDAPRLFAGLLLSLLLNLFGGSVCSFDDLAGSDAGLLNRLLGLLEPVLSLLARLVGRFQLLGDLPLPGLCRTHHRRIDPAREDAEHDQEGDELHHKGGVDL